MQGHLQDEYDLNGLFDDLSESVQLARQTHGKGCVYVMATPGIEAVRIGRTVDPFQRVRWFEYKNFLVEIILLGECNALDPEAKRAEEEVFHLLGDIRLSEHNP